MLEILIHILLFELGIIIAMLLIWAYEELRFKMSKWPEHTGSTCSEITGGIEKNCNWNS